MLNERTRAVKKSVRSEEEEERRGGDQRGAALPRERERERESRMERWGVTIGWSNSIAAIHHQFYI